MIVFEATPLATDQVLSTHTIHPAGMDVLDELGVGEAVRSLSPPARRIRFQVDGAHADVEPPAGRDECCPRRYRLDGLLQEAALAAGAEIREAARVTELLGDGERVVGVRAESAGRTIEARGTVTVGADGRRSTVARLVDADEYLGYQDPRAMYWAYWEPPAAWTSPEYAYDALLSFSGEDRRVIFSTDHGQLLMATLPIVSEARRWRPDLEACYEGDLRKDPAFERLVSEGQRASKIIGTLSERFFFRRSAGKGWALVGDAGHHKHPILGWGISEALVQAKKLAQAIGAGGDTALERYWRQRDVDALPRFRMGEDRAAPRPITPVFPIILDKLGRARDSARQLYRETEYESNPYDLLPPARIALWTLAAAIRQLRPQLLLDFIAQGRRAAAVQAELDERRRLLDAVPSRSKGQTPSVP